MGVEVYQGAEPTKQAVTRLLDVVGGGNSSSAVERLVSQGRSERTWTAYRSDLRDFARWCVEEGREPLPATPEAVSEYVAGLVDQQLSLSTIERRCSAIAAVHHAAGVPSPTSSDLVRQLLRGVRRELGVSSDGAKDPVWLEDLVRMVRTCSLDRLQGVRDRAILLVGWACALRRSELAALDVEHLTRRPQGVEVVIARSKTDQDGAGERLPLFHGRSEETCPVSALAHWREAAQVEDGALFRRIDRYDRVLEQRLAPRGFALVIKRAAERAGLDPARFGGHSLRSGFASQAKAGNADDRAIMQITRHRSLSGLTPYLRRGALFQQNVAGLAGL